LKLSCFCFILLDINILYLSSLKLNSIGKTDLVHSCLGFNTLKVNLSDGIHIIRVFISIVLKNNILSKLISQELKCI